MARDRSRGGQGKNVMPLLQHRHPVEKEMKVKEGHTPKEHRRGAHLPFIGR